MSFAECVVTCWACSYRIKESNHIEWRNAGAIGKCPSCYRFLKKQLEAEAERRATDAHLQQELRRKRARCLRRSLGLLTLAAAILLAVANGMPVNPFGLPAGGLWFPAVPALLFVSAAMNLTVALRTSQLQFARDQMIDERITGLNLRALVSSSIDPQT